MIERNRVRTRRFDFLDDFRLSKIPNLDAIFRSGREIVSILRKGQSGDLARVSI